MIRNRWRLFAWDNLLGAALLVLATWAADHLVACEQRRAGIRRCSKRSMATRCPRPWACSARRLGRLGRWLSRRLRPMRRPACTLPLCAGRAKIARAALQATFICNALDWLAGAGGNSNSVFARLSARGQNSNLRITKSWHYQRIFPAAQMGAYEVSLRCYAHPLSGISCRQCVRGAARFSALRVSPAAAPGLQQMMVFQLPLETAPHPPSLGGPGAATRSPADLRGDQ